jgi:RNA polymerase sigma factor (TIGR02999 family)
MSDSRPAQAARVLRALEQGNALAAGSALPRVYGELRSLARWMLANAPPGNSLQPTALVHEAYLRLVGGEDPGWNGQGHFFGAAARAMRRILVEQARRKGAVKHGGGLRREDIETADVVAMGLPAEDMLALDEALERLSQRDPRVAQVVELRYFAGLDVAETAQVLGVSEPTVERDWREARTFLHDQLA